MLIPALGIKLSSQIFFSNYGTQHKPISSKNSLYFLYFCIFVFYVFRMESSPYTEPPKFKPGTFALLFGQSQSGKSTWLKNVLLEHECHFETAIKKLVYVYQNKDNENLPILMETFKKIGTFQTDLPLDIEDGLVENHSILILDDLELMMRCKEKRRVLQRLSMETAHHKKIYVFFSFQTYGVFYKRSPLNEVLYQATNLLLFRSLNYNAKSLKAILVAVDAVVTM